MKNRSRLALFLLWLSLSLILLPSLGWESLAQSAHGILTKLMVQEGLLLLLAL